MPVREPEPASEQLALRRTMARPTLTFLGATGTVTGSRFLVESDRGRALVDCGLYQGIRELRRRNWAPLPFAADAVDGVVLTHAHLDHSGALPRLAREGFTGPVVCTEETAELAAIVLRDSAHLQEEDAAYANDAGYSRHRPALPLYAAADAEALLRLLRRVPFGAVEPLAEGISATLAPAGHILGSSTALLDVDGARVLFSGDLGRPHHPLLDPPDPPAEADVVVVESTYGDRRHSARPSTVFADAIRRTVRRGGTVLVPAFAVDRTEIVLMHLRRLMTEGEIPRVPVYVDSPMALATLEVYRRALHRSGSHVRPGLDPDPFDPGDLHAVRDAAGSMALNRPGRPCILVSASGMASGGRVVHHLRHQLPDPRNCVVLTGFRAAGTRGRQLAEGARTMKVHGTYVPVRAEVVEVPEFSTHADADEIIGWLAGAPRPPRVVYVVHGEPDAATALAGRIQDGLDWCAVVPRHGERVRLDR
jgi:metallo-beta-lactamase family protein